MAVSTTNAYSGPFTANGATVAFPFTFTAPTVDEVSVVLQDGDGVETVATGYSVELTSGSGGTVTFTTAPESGYSVYILLDPDFTQDIEFEDGSPWRASPVNQGYDRSAYRDQKLKGETDRAIKVPFGQTGYSLINISDGQSVALVNGNLQGVDNDPAAAEASAIRAETAEENALAYAERAEALQAELSDVTDAFDAMLDVVISGDPLDAALLGLFDFPAGGFSARAVALRALPDFVQTRTGAAFAMAGSGLTAVAENVARIAEDGVFTSIGRTQLIVENTVFAGWGLTNAAITDAGENCPTGAAYKVLTASSTSGRMAISYNLALATVHRFGMVVRNDNAGRSAVRVVVGGSTIVAALYWNWDGARPTNIYGTNSSNVSNVEFTSLGNDDWYVSFAFTSHAATASHSFQVLPSTSIGTEAIWAGQADCWASAVPAPPMGAATEGADTLTFPVAVWPEEATVGFDFTVPVSFGDYRLSTLDNGDADTDDAIVFAVTAAGLVTLNVTVGGVSQISASTTASAMPGSDMRCTFWKDGASDLWQWWMGDQLIASGTDALPAISRWCIGHGGDAGKRAQTNVRNVVLSSGDYVWSRTGSGCPVIDIIRLHGQSNAAGRGTYSELFSGYEWAQWPQYNSGRIYHTPDAYTADDFTTNADLRHPCATGIAYPTAYFNSLNNDAVTNVCMTPALMKGRGNNVVLVKYAITATQLDEDPTIDDWDPDSVGELYDLANASMTAAVARLRAAGYKIGNVRLHWYQGERDGALAGDYASYEANLTDLLDKWKTWHEDAGFTDFKVILYRLSVNQTPVTYLTEIRTAQTAVAAALDYVGLVDTDTVTTKPADPIHIPGDQLQVAGALGRAVEVALG